MECNKDEAKRAKEIAEKKMRNNDFVGAQRIALKAQQLFPELENITQLLAVCNVHCSAETRILGSEKDWYSILQVERLADEVTIKKQYRKLALVLHPDKNKYPGAEAAFKLIGEAHVVLSDRGKRSIFDRKFASSITSAQAKPPTRQANVNPAAKKQFGVQKNTPNGFAAQVSGLNHHQTKQANSTPVKSFWTCCPYCDVKYLHYTEYVNKVLRCQKCLKPFVAYDIAASHVFLGSNQSQPAAQGVFTGFNQSQAAAQGTFPGLNQSHAATQGVFPGSNQSHTTAQSVPRQYNWSQPAVSKPKDFLAHETYRTGVDRTAGSATSRLGPQGNTNGRTVGSVSGTETMSSMNAGLGNRNVDNANPSRGVNESSAIPNEEVMKSGEAAEVSNENRRRGRKQELESSESCDTSSSSDVVDMTFEEIASNPAGEQSSGFNAFHAPRRSSRHKHQVSYNESGSDNDDFESPPKKPRKGKSSSNGEGLQQGTANDTPNFANPADQKEDVPVDGGLPAGDAKVCQNQAAGQAASASHGGAEKVEIIDDSESDDDSCPEFFQLPDPEFNDFDKGREESCFAANQFWACYDDVDGMPRFYAKIKKVHSPGFKIHINWLEPDPDYPEQIDWAEQFPVGCGKFRLGNPELILSRLTFSHQVLCDKYMGKGPFMIYPRKDETWALFNGWDIKWSTDPGNHKKYKYEMVQIISDFVEGAGTKVAFLEKVRGFVSLFQQRSRNPARSVLIPSSDLFRFSHRVPSFKMSGTEKEGVPEGCFELDPACLPANPDDICYPHGVEVDEKIFSAKADGSCSEASQKNKSKLSESEITPKNLADRKGGFVGETCKVRRSPRGLKIAEKEKIHASASNVSVQTATAIHNHGKGGQIQSEFSPLKAAVSVSKSDKELEVQMQELSPCKSNSIHQSLSPSGKVSEDFHDFKEDRSEGKFKLDQIWALYTPEHKLPKMYGQIKKIGRSPFTLYVAPLESSLVPKSATQPACGTFVVRSGKVQPLETCSFSHLLKADSIVKNRVEIFPKVGEVWALYGKWDAESSLSELENCECHVVEILDCTDGRTKVLPLVPLKPYSKSLFRSPRRQRSGIETMHIEKHELARFSHQIPAFQLTSEKGGSLAGCWQLDRASVPRKLVPGG
ncbi:uncharacterized protein [Coffea arabica]|uniref:Uncharacterized protein isoform X1 n=1 Tax=Coffea arabica TaxID=13443 RepID=A0A6P6VY79_COFAR